MKYLKLVNKTNPLPPYYRPSNMIKIEPRVKGSINPNRKIWINKTLFKKWNGLVTAAKESSFEFYISSGYRSYFYQRKVLKHYVEKEGVDEALSHVARPGCLEHQTGLAIDYFFVRDGINHYDMLDNDEEYHELNNSNIKVMVK